MGYLCIAATSAFVPTRLIARFRGCSNGEQASPFPSETSSEAMPSATSPLSAYQSVLQNKAEFFSSDANKDLSFSQLNQAVSVESSVIVKAKKLAIVDLENDGTPEVIL